MGILLEGTAVVLQLDTFLGYATTILTWMLTSFGSIIAFFVENPALFVWFILAIVGAAFILSLIHI